MPIPNEPRRTLNPLSVQDQVANHTNLDVGDSQFGKQKTSTVNAGAREGRPSAGAPAARSFAHCCLLMRADLPMLWPCLTAVE
jgi:hypothetical protein